ncbi:hypothetical protein AOLI_G00171340 [Acnodon oligacanthus]
MQASQIRQDYHYDCEAPVNRMVNMERCASYTYTSMKRRKSAEMESQIHQNYHRDCQAAINRMVNMEFYASYTYTSMNKRGGYIFLQDAHFFKENSHEEREHAEKFLEFQNKIGGCIFLQDVRLCDFLESHYTNEQVEMIKKLGDHITNLTKMDAGNNRMAEYLFDKHTLGSKS